MTPAEYCQNKAGASGSSFYYSFVFLPPEQRAAITALYAFCREVDDVVDETTHREVAATKLAWWRREIAQTFAGAAQHPVTRALTPAIAHYHLPQTHFDEILNGMEMDLYHTGYDSFAELNIYCYRVASAVGLLSATIFGYSDERTLGFARDLGTALQLTNIVRDVGEDARRGRIYLPREELERYGVTSEAILRCEDSPALRELLAQQAARAEEYYEKAYAQLPPQDRYAQLPSLIMARIYRALLQEIRNDHFAVMNYKTGLPVLRKLWLAWSTLRQERRARRRHKGAAVAKRC